MTDSYIQYCRRRGKERVRGLADGYVAELLGVPLEDIKKNGLDELIVAKRELVKLNRLIKNESGKKV